MNELATHRGTFAVARATREDIVDIVALLADDEIGEARESTDLRPYLAAFDRIDADPNQLLVIIRDDEGRPVGTTQLTLVPGLSRVGATRLLIEGVRIHSSARGTGLGTALLAWAHDHGRSHGALLAQLTSDKHRAGAHRFYEQLGYEASHEGFKVSLT